MVLGFLRTSSLGQQQHLGSVIATSLQLDELSVMHMADDRDFGQKLLLSTMLGFFQVESS